MSNWKTKSENNKKSAHILIGHNFFSCSIHHLYYSNVQLILHIFIKSIGWSENDISIRQKEYSKSEKAGFHNWIEHEIIQSLFKKRRIDDARNFSRHFPQLKILRVRADYKNELISKASNQNAVEISNEIEDILKTNYLS